MVNEFPPAFAGSCIAAEQSCARCLMRHFVNDILTQWSQEIKGKYVLTRSRKKEKGLRRCFGYSGWFWWLWLPAERVFVCKSFCSFPRKKHAVRGLMPAQRASFCVQELLVTIVKYYPFFLRLCFWGSTSFPFFSFWSTFVILQFISTQSLSTS